MKFLLLGRKPVLDRSQAVVAYHVSFNGASLKQKLAQVNYTACISQLLHTFRLENALDGKKAWIKVDNRALLHTDLTLLSKDIFTFYVMRIDALDEALLLKIDELLDEGYEFVLEDGVANAIMKSRGVEHLSRFSSIVFDGRHKKSYAKVVSALQAYDISCTIRNVLNKDSYDYYKDEGFSSFIGSYFKEPAVIKGREISASRLKLLELLRLLKSDAEMEEIITTIKFSPSISLQLLHYINSANTQTTQHVESIRDATTLLGRKRLTAWVMMSLYASTEDEIPPVLVDSAMIRAQLMEYLCDTLRVTALKDQAYLVGFLSLADTVFKIYLGTILERGCFSKAIQEALIEKKGDLAKLLHIAKVIESGNPKNIEAVSKKVKIPAEHFSELLSQSYAYVIDTRKASGF